MHEVFKINDAHIHIGHSKDVHKYLNNLAKFTVENNINFSLIMGNSIHNNETIEAITKKDPNVFGLYWITALGNYAYQINDRMVGFKFHGAYEGRPITHPLYAEVLDYLDLKKGILTVHCGRYKEGNIDSNTSYLHALKIAESYPNINVIMAHMGGTDTTISKKAILEAIDFDNIYFDTSGITTPYIIEFACENLSSKKILFGSDAPWCSFRAMYYTVIDAEIGYAEKINIFQNNFVDLMLKPMIRVN